MKILVNGPSVTLGPISWPVQLEKKIACEIVNFSRVGCGNNYIHDSTILELSQRKYDLVVISWTYFFRRDFRIKTPGAVLHGLELEDPHLHKNPYLDKFWFFLRHTHPPGADVSTYTEDLERYNSALDLYSTMYSDEQRLEETLLNIISLQSVLKNLNIPYVFTFYKPLLHLKKLQHLYDQIDYDHVHGVHICHLARQNNWERDRHPDTPAHIAYADTLLEHPVVKDLLTTTCI